MGGKGSDKDAIEFAVENGYRPAKLVRDPQKEVVGPSRGKTDGAER